MTSKLLAAIGALTPPGPGISVWALAFIFGFFAIPMVAGWVTGAVIQKKPGTANYGLVIGFVCGVSAFASFLAVVRFLYVDDWTVLVGVAVMLLFAAVASGLTWQGHLADKIVRWWQQGGRV